MSNTRTAQNNRQNASDRFEARATRAARYARSQGRSEAAQTGRYAARQYIAGIGMVSSDEAV